MYRAGLIGMERVWIPPDIHAPIVSLTLRRGVGCVSKLSLHMVRPFWNYLNDTDTFHEYYVSKPSYCFSGCIYVLFGQSTLYTSSWKHLL